MTLALSNRRLHARSTASATDYREFWPTDLDFMLYQAAGLISGEIGATAPVDTTKLWLDTSAGVVSPGIWKYYTGSAWATVAGTTEVAQHILARGAPGVFLTDGDKGDVVVSSSGTVWELDPVASVARIVASVALDTLKDSLFGSLEATDARAVVNAIQADATALADLQSSIAHYMDGGDGTLSAASSTTSPVVLTLPTQGGVYDVSVTGFGSSAGTETCTLQISRDGGSTWTTMATAAASAPTVCCITWRVFLPATGTTAYANVTGINWAGSQLDGPGVISVTNDGSSPAKFRLTAATGNVGYARFRALRVA